MRRYFAFLGAAVLVAVLGGTWLFTVYARNDNSLASCGVGQVAGGSAQIGGPFELVNASGETVTDKDVITEPSLVYFGYTFCPDVCPMDMARNADAVDLLQDAGYGVTPVFITVDPDRDTPEVVGDFADNMHERMIGLTGSAEQIKDVSQGDLRRTLGESHKAAVDSSTCMGSRRIHTSHFERVIEALFREGFHWRCSIATLRYSRHRLSPKADMRLRLQRDERRPFLFRDSAAASPPATSFPCPKAGPRRVQVRRP